MKTLGFGQTDIGTTRESNEDAYLIDDQLGLYAVCDGVGGHAAGEVAARKTIDMLQGIIRENSGFLRGLRRDATADSQIVRFVETIVYDVCAAVWDMALTNARYAGMGTTLTLMLNLGGRAVMGHVGDSRLYLLRDEQVHQLSDDHTCANDLVRAGAMTPEQASRHRLRHALTRSIGVQQAVQVDTLVFDLLPGDLYLLCSDGVTDPLDGPQELADAMEGMEPSAVPDRLIDFAKAKGSTDNVTVVVIEVGAGRAPRPEDEDRRRATEQGIDRLGQMPLFAGLPLRDLLRLLNTAEVAVYETGEILMCQGVPCTHYRLVVDGEVRLSTQDGRSKTIGGGETFGVVSLLDCHPAHATAEVSKDAWLASIPCNRVDRILRLRPRLGLRVFRQLGKLLASRLDASDWV